jgi:hypothetical protein
MATRAEREQEEAEAERARQRGHATQQPDPADKVAAEQQKQAEAAAKEQRTYLDEMNKKIGDVVNTAASAKDKDPQLLNYTVQALKNAAAQLEAATPQGMSKVA